MESGDSPGAPVSRRHFAKAVLAASVAGVALGAYSWRVEPHWLQIVERPLSIAGLPQGLEGARLVHFSDLHVGPQVSDDYVLGAFSRVSELDADVVVITGDFTSYHADVIDHAERIYSRLPHGRLATVGILGNHDYGHGWSDYGVADRLAAVLSGLGVTVLRNELVDVGGLQIVGMDDLWADRFRPDEALMKVESGRAVLALSHNPDTADLPGWEGFEGWILAGHTHGGQCKPPFLPPPQLPVINRRYTAGEFPLGDGRSMYISRGLGHTLKVRFNVRPEVTVFTLNRA